MTGFSVASPRVRAASQQKGKRIPAKLLVSVAGSPGRQKLLISVAAADGILIPQSYIVVRDGEQFMHGQTGVDGTVVYQANFKEPSRAFEVRAGNGPALDWQARLLGPKRRGA